MFKKDIVYFFSRDLDQLAKEVNKIPEEYIWKSVPGITNSCGVLAQHIVGNLNHYIGRCIGDTGYERDRDLEFTNTGLVKSKLIVGINSTKDTVEKVLEDSTEDELSNPYQFYTPKDFTVEQFLIHLYGHLNYHLGQVNYLRRILTENNG